MKWYDAENNRHSHAFTSLKKENGVMTQLAQALKYFI